MIAIKIYASAKELSNKIKLTPRLQAIATEEEEKLLGEIAQMGKQSETKTILNRDIIGILANIDLKEMDESIRILKEATK